MVKTRFFFCSTGWMYAITKNYEPAFYMAGAFTTLGVCLLFLVPFLLPPEVVEEWCMRTNGFRMRVQSSTSSEATKSWTLDSGSYYSDSERESLQDYEKKHSTVTYVEDVFESSVSKRQSGDSGLGFILEKYFSMPKFVNQKDCLLGNFNSDYSSNDVWIHSLDPNRETIV